MHNKIPRWITIFGIFFRVNAMQDESPIHIFLEMGYEERLFCKSSFCISWAKCNCIFFLPHIGPKPNHLKLTIFYHTYDNFYKHSENPLSIKKNKNKSILQRKERDKNIREKMGVDSKSFEISICFRINSFQKLLGVHGHKNSQEFRLLLDIEILTKVYSKHFE